MLSRTARLVLRSCHISGRPGRTASVPMRTLTRGFQTSASMKKESEDAPSKDAKDDLKAAEKTAEEVFTNLKNEHDPVRDRMFEYNWGTWLRNDEAEKQKRVTKFSLSGMNILIRDLGDVEITSGSRDEVLDVGSNVKAITKNLDELTGAPFKNIKQLISIHEGLSHHVYRIILDNGKNLVLRLPYNLYPNYYTERAVNSEAATTDFLQSNLGLKVPKVLAYSGKFDNPLNYPFILTEYIEGELLMKEWYPLVKGKVDDEKVSEELHKVIDPIAGFFKAVSTPIFTGYGSLYFKEDLPEGKPALEGEERYVLGPTTLKPYYERVSDLTEKEVDQYVGPWTVDQPLGIVSDYARLIIKSLQKKLSNAQSKDNKSLVGSIQASIRVYERLLAVSDKLFNFEKSSIPNFKELIKPRLFIPDLDPMNVIISKNGKYFVDFEDSTVTPFILNPAPKFVEYTGPKVFDISEVPDFEKLEDELKEQYEYMQKKTRNQVYWEKELVDKVHDLAVAAAPAVKKIREVFTTALKDKNDKDYLNVEGALADIQQLWSSFSKDHVVGEGDCPVGFTKEDIEKFEKDFMDFQKELSSTPFAATNGWVPQDVFENLQRKGVIVKDGDNYKIDIESLLRGPEEKDNKKEKE
ncbi:DEKNAAC101994 [Brettanomyces naardenensis]|uniref:Altered inheritance of mitochondria protein 9, mitochondrial n=1 Tax=Brettanomyces naardenensis TaxID=13370 RepID=A0A448YJE2_BRENA|nr:DEKNAAC101994 [Brettanomyces naardenensis]